MPSEKPASCAGCPLAVLGTGYVPANGAATNSVVLVGEAPGETEVRTSKAFTGAAGWMLDRVLRRAGLERGEFGIVNCLNCRPPNNVLVGAPYEAAALAHCRPNLDAALARWQPKVLVPMGGTALRALTNETSITKARGFVFPHASGAWVVPTYHPSYLLPRQGQANTSRFVGTVVRDLRKAVEIARVGYSRPEVHYLCDPNPEQFGQFILEYERALAADPDCLLAWDIETPYKLTQKDKEDLELDEEEEEGETSAPKEDPILRISFAFRPRFACSVPWSGPYMEGIKRLLGSIGAKATWNGTIFDVPRVREHRIEVGGPHQDFMWAWHMLQSDLLKKLERVASFYATHLLPWKHLSGAEPIWYSATDADATICIALAVREELQTRGQWSAFLRHVTQLDPILWQAGQVTGVQIDVVAQGQLREILSLREGELTAQAQAVVPDHLKPVEVKKGVPKGKDYTIVMVPGQVKSCSICGAAPITKGEHMKGACRHGELVMVEGEVATYHVKSLFNLQSGPQLMAYALAHKHPLGRDKHTKRPSLGKKDVERLVKRYGEKHPLYGIVKEHRGISKTLSVNVVGFQPDQLGRIYTTYNHKPATARLASNSVNLQNVSKRSGVAYAKEVRRTIIPPPGRVFVEADSAAIEAVMTGYFMGDPRFIALAQRGIHDFLACSRLGINFETADLPALKRDPAYKDLREIMKVVVYGNAFGAGPKLMALEHPERFKTVAAAKEMQDFFYAQCPGLPKWQHSTRLQAHSQSYLVNPWNYRRYFYDVFQKDREGNISLGGDANKAIGFLPQSSAACFMMDNLLLLWGALVEVGGEDWLPANCVVHDSYLLAVPPERVEWAMATLARILTRPIAEMGGLRVGCEMSTGANWGDMQTAQIVGVS